MPKASQSQKHTKYSRTAESREVFPNAELQWLSRHPLGSVSLPENVGSKDMKQFLWPDSLDYHSPLNSLLLAQVETLADLNAADSWFIRDGYIGIFHFFQKFPRPKNVKTQLYVHDSFAELVPDSWRASVQCYSFQQKSPAVMPNKLLVCGLACLSGAHEIHRSEILERLKKKLGAQNLAKKEIYLFMPARDFNLLRGQTIHAEIFYRLFRFFTSQVKIVSWAFIISQKSFENFLVVNLNPSAVLADSYINNYIISQGGTVFDMPSARNLDHVDFQLSNFHGVVTGPLPPKKSVKKNLSKALSSDPSFHALPWRNWFKLKANV